MPAICALISDDSSAESLLYLPAEPNEGKNKPSLRIVRNTEDSCNSVLGGQISITDTDDFTGTFVVDIIGDLTRKLNEIYKLSDNWDGYGTAAPNTMAFLHAWDVIEVLRNIDFIPVKLIPSAEEGIGFYFEKENRYGFVECFNDGEIVLAMSDRGGYRRAWQISDSIDEIEESLEILKDFIDVD